MAEKRDRDSDNTKDSEKETVEKHPRLDKNQDVAEPEDDERYDDGGGGDTENIYGKYEYLDHTADVQLHAWGDSLKEAFEQVVQAMFNYMTTDFSTVEMTEEQEVEAEGDDMESLLFHFMDEWLFAFCAEPYFIARKIEITEMDLENFKIKSKGYGEEFDLEKHPQGTEVKAITYSNMQIYDNDKKHEVFVIIDI
ncbi:protein archease-like [Mya arenaria]|uniref:protein archease-like n=1 Tax=Mya arenaria TaxID=6604 RepID=UPI0022E5D1BF|nr:protein archease-like [Mya arenaria]